MRLCTARLSTFPDTRLGDKLIIATEYFLYTFLACNFESIITFVGARKWQKHFFMPNVGEVARSLRTCFHLSRSLPLSPFSSITY